VVTGVNALVKSTKKSDASNLLLNAMNAEVDLIHAISLCHIGMVVYADKRLKKISYIKAIRMFVTV